MSYPPFLSQATERDKEAGNQIQKVTSCWSLLLHLPRECPNSQTVD